jgi:2-dehydropantoate 2-reductase
VLVKSFHTADAVREAIGLVGPDSAVLSLQNGLGHEDILTGLIGRDRVIAGKTYVGGVMLGPGHVIAGLAGKETIIGELDGRITPRVARIAATFEAAGMKLVISCNIMGAMWDKLLVNIATGALSGITRLTYGGLYAVPELELTATAAVAEAIAVAKASGIALETEHPHDAWVKAASGLPPEFKASMLQSLEKGSATEVDFINGAVVRAGTKTGVPTPVNATLVACVKGIERAAHCPVGR